MTRCLFLFVLVSSYGAASTANPDSTRVAPKSPHATRVSPLVSLSPSPSTNSVLVLYPDNRLRPANVLFDRSFREKLGGLLGASVDCFGEFLDEEHFPASHQERMRDFLRTKYKDRLPDVIVAFAAPSREFCARYCSQLFPDVPIVFAALGADSAWGHDLGLRVTGVRSSFDAEALTPPAIVAFVSVLTQSATDVFVGRQELYRSADGGLHWRQIDDFPEAPSGSIFDIKFFQKLPDSSSSKGRSSGASTAARLGIRFFRRAACSCRRSTQLAGTLFTPPAGLPTTA